jgi:hypothetical protein
VGEDKQQDEGPLGAEARKREEWRGEQHIVQEEEASGHTRPVSEGDAAAEGSGDPGAGGQGVSAPATPPPPD